MNTEKGSSVVVFGDKVLERVDKLFQSKNPLVIILMKEFSQRGRCVIGRILSYRCIDDAATMLNVLAGHDVMDSTSVPDQHQPITLPDDVDVSNLHIGTNSAILSSENIEQQVTNLLAVGLTV